MAAKSTGVPYLCAMFPTETICALSTAPGMGAIAVIRISGPDAFQKLSSLLAAEPKIEARPSHKAFVSQLVHDGEWLDEVLVTPFKGPRSYTGEDVVELACHGSIFIQQRILEVLQAVGVRLARPGEFTLRAFGNGRMDLIQAEAVADLIASENQAAHRLAMNQMRGGFSQEIGLLREELIQFASLVELELDFSEEDVEFADRTKLIELLIKIEQVIHQLLGSFRLGNVIKNGFPVAIAGAPNAGKSTLLNALLREERALVSDIAGTTRDTVEDEITIDGIKYRFIDTAGLRQTEDVVEKMGIDRAYKKMGEAECVLFLFDARRGVHELRDEQNNLFAGKENVQTVVVLNKVDELSAQQSAAWKEALPEAVLISAKHNVGIEGLIKKLTALVGSSWKGDQTIVTNARHVQALQQAKESLDRVRFGLENEVSGELVAMDIRQVLFHLGELTGDISTEDLLGSIFSKFCIGK